MGRFVPEGSCCKQYVMKAAKGGTCHRRELAVVAAAGFRQRPLSTRAMPKCLVKGMGE